MTIEVNYSDGEALIEICGDFYLHLFLNDAEIQDLQQLLRRAIEENKKLEITDAELPLSFGSVTVRLDLDECQQLLSALN